MGGIRKPPEPPRPSIVRMELETMVLGVCETIWINCMRHFVPCGWSAFRRLLFVCLFGPYRFDSGKEGKMERFGSNETMGERIRSKRKELGYSQERLAELLMVKQNTLSNYENDLRDVPTEIVSLLAEKLNTTPSYLIWGKPEEEDDEWLFMIEEIASRSNDLSLRETALKQLTALTRLDAKMGYHKM